MIPVREPVVASDPVAAGLQGQGLRRALFLDRDGVINVDHGYVHSPEQTQWVPGIFDLTRAARRAGYVIVIVTNQAGIARGYYDVAQFERYTRWMHDAFSREGIHLLATYYCPHHAEAGQGEWRVGCVCRKPAPGMLLSAADRFDLDVQGSIMIGDTIKDMEAGQAAGVGCCILVNRPSAMTQLAKRLFVAADAA